MAYDAGLRVNADDGRLALEGTWLGTLQTPAMKLRIVFHITAKADGSLSATLDSPDQGTTGIAVARVGLEKNQVTMSSRGAVQGRYEGTLGEDGSTMGKWTQGGIPLDLPLQRVNEAGKIEPAARAQEALPVHRRGSCL